MTNESDGDAFVRGRFAPSATGPAHPGTLLAGLLCWLDARSRGAEVVLRIEDLDRARTKPGFVDGLRRDFEWFGLDWDRVVLQSERRAAHEAAVDRLVREGRVYACDCSRRKIREHGGVAPDGSSIYPGTCRARRVSAGTWREEPDALRIELDDLRVSLSDESGADLSGRPARDFGDPLLRRRDGAYAYHLVSVVDDGVDEIDRVVRGRDLMPSTALQVALRGLLDIEVPRYRHHVLVLERRGEKLAKLHGAVGAEALRRRHDAEELMGILAGVVGLAPMGERTTAGALVADFDWAKVREDDFEVVWDEVQGLAPAEEAAT